MQQGTQAFLLHGISFAVSVYHASHYSLNCFICIVIKVLKNKLKIFSTLLPQVPDSFSMTMPLFA